MKINQAGLGSRHIERDGLEQEESDVPKQKSHTKIFCEQLEVDWGSSGITTKSAERQNEAPAV